MVEGGQKEVDYVIAFKSGNKLVAEQLLPRIPQPAAITTTFEFSSRYPLLALVSLLHLAAYWGWRNVVTSLVSVYKCARQLQGRGGTHSASIMPPTTNNNALECMQHSLNSLPSQAWPDPSRLRMGQETLVLSSCRSGMCTTQ